MTVPDVPLDFYISRLNSLASELLDSLDLSFLQPTRRHWVVEEARRIIPTVIEAGRTEEIPPAFAVIVAELLPES